VKKSLAGEAFPETAQRGGLDVQEGGYVMQGDPLEYLGKAVDQLEIPLLSGQALDLDQPADETVVVPEHFLFVPIPDLRKASFQGQEVGMGYAQEFTVFHRLDVQLGGLGSIDAFQVADPPVFECEIEYMLASIVIHGIGTGTTFVQVGMQGAYLSGPEEEVLSGKIFPPEIGLHEHILLFLQPNGAGEKFCEGGGRFEAVGVHAGIVSERTDRCFRSS
jgi:hypothetical protein